MKYVSTRGGVPETTFENALFSSYAPDGGLYLPVHIPKLSKDVLKSWTSLTYPQLVKQILPLFISEDELPVSDMNEIIDRAFSRFSNDSVVQLSELNNGLNILELWHGPTMAFKDLALSCVGQLLDYFLNKRQRHVTILVATSGDTGSAAIESVRGLRWADIVVLLPRGRCTRIQELQMTTALADNVNVVRVDGCSDDADIALKPVFTDKEFVNTHGIMSINSINWARVLIQTAHYFFTYLKMCPTCDEQVEIAVPTGACGNVSAGLIARQMGLPIRLVTTVNVNDVVAKTISAGEYNVCTNVKQTLAPAMDILMPYNMERLFYLLLDGDGKKVAALMQHVESGNTLSLPADLHKKMRETFSSFVVSDDGIKEAMVKCWRENNYLLCPHTAVAAKYHYDNPTDLKRVCVATASPAKFEEAVEAAGLSPQPTEAVSALFKKETKYTDWEKNEDWEKNIRDLVQNITSARCL